MTPSAHDLKIQAITSYFEASAKATIGLIKQGNEILAAGEAIVEALGRGNKILFCGNGGCAAHAQHLAAELVGKFQKPRKPLAALAITVDSSILTAVSNDFDFSHVFSRQIAALAKPGDILFAMTTSGKSENVNLALAEAKARGLMTVLLTSESAVPSHSADHTIMVPSALTWHIQEAQIAVGHLLCSLIETQFEDDVSS